MADERSGAAPGSGRNYGLLAALGLGALAGGTMLACVPFVAPALRRHVLPYVPATDGQMANVIAAVRLLPPTARRRHRRMVDLGSGDGRVALSLCRATAGRCDGVELNSVLVAWSRAAAIGAKLANPHVHRPAFYWNDLWKVDLSRYDTVVFFGTESDSMMRAVGSKAAGTATVEHLVACRHPLPVATSPDNGVWRLLHEIGGGTEAVWVYEKIKNNI